MKKVLTILLSVLLVILTGCSARENGKLSVVDYTQEISKQEIIEVVKSINVAEDVTFVFSNEYVASRHLDGWVIVVTPIEVTVLHDVYDDEACASVAGVVAKAGAGLSNEDALQPMAAAAAKKIKTIEIEESAYTVFLMGFIAFLALTFVASMINDAVPSNSFAGRASSAFLGFAAGFFAGGGGSHKSSSFGGRSGGSATVRR